MTQESAGPLEGVRVIDLTTVLMGPYSTRIMGDLGADVIRVETPTGEDLRRVGPSRSDDMGWFVLNLQRNKRSIAIDLKSEAGRDEMDELLATADVLVTNMRRPALERLGLDYERVAERHPRLLYCIANGFGSDGPYADHAAYDDVIQSVSGLASMAQWSGDEPRFVPSVIGDKVGGLHIVYAVLAALYRRTQSGRGDLIEVPMAEVLGAFNLVEHLAGHTFDPPIGPIGYERLRSPHRKPRRASDGWFCLLPYSDVNWRDFFTAVGRRDLADDERFADRPSRTRHADALWNEVDEILLGRTVDDWLELCAEWSVPAAPILALDELHDDEHFAAVGLIETVEHPTEGAYRWVKQPVRSGVDDVPPRRHAPHLDEHGDEIRRELAERREATGSSE